MYKFLHCIHENIYTVYKIMFYCLAKMTRQEDQKHIFNFVWPALDDKHCLGDPIRSAPLFPSTATVILKKGIKTISYKPSAGVFAYIGPWPLLISKLSLPQEHPQMTSEWRWE